MKSATDAFWNERAASVAEDIEVNIMDIFQRELEYDAVCRYLRSDMRLLEVGCGNGFSTRRFRSLVAHVDAFDYSPNMVERARAEVGEENNRFFQDDILDPKRLEGPYDTVVCVRVLINLPSVADQHRAVENMAHLVRTDGLLLLVEGFTEGFEELTRVRTRAGLSPLEPAAINVYAALASLQPTLERHFTLEDTFHLGAYDFLTRVVYPAVAGEENVRHNSVFSERCVPVARAFNPDCLESLSRIRGLVLRKSR